jgi:Protein of unknown function (DUF1207)
LARGGLYALLLALAAPRASVAQAPVRSATVALPRGDLFAPLLADPKEPQALAAVLKTWRAVDTHAALIGFGQVIGIVRWRAARPGDGVQLGIAPAIFAQFDLDTPSNDLINADYLIGLPLSARWGPWSARLRIYHQSSHLGDEYLLDARPERINLSFEAVELLVAREFGPLRVYGGGEYLVRRDPASLNRGLAHGGAELSSAPLVGLGGFGRARAVLAVDLKAPGEDRFAVGTSVRAGLVFSGSGPVPRSWSVLIHFYAGPVPYGQFYTEDITSLGAGLSIAP